MVECREPFFEIRKHKMSGMAMSQEILTTFSKYKDMWGFFFRWGGGILDCSSVKKS